MEFSYRVSEQDYLQAWKLQCKHLRKRSVLKIALFWIFILICLMLLWSAINRSNENASRVQGAAQNSLSEPQPEQSPASTGPMLLLNVGPFLLLGGIWVVALPRIQPRLVRRIYRNDPVMQGEFTVGVSSDGLTVRNTAGLTSQSDWKILEYWAEEKNVLVLAYWSRAHFVMSLRELSDLQRGELRAILTQALAKR